MRPQRPRRVLAISSGGGHWVELLRLRPALAGAKVTYACVRRSYAADVPDEDFWVLPDATLWNKFKLLHLAVRVAWLVVAVRPDVIISTGAAPGYFAVRFGGWLGAKTLWVDSIANAATLSKSGAKIAPHATEVLSQWHDVAERDGVSYAGAVL